ncbi:MAG: hypothetical protein CL910_12130 [Deltaproteobacteria bacterium]|jgi:hypothetical protein|nr:hypothetical protein [Deltaproteobacteria bacterium]
MSRVFLLSLALAGIALTAPASPGLALPLLSEVFYDAVGADDGKVFVELSGTPGASLAGHRLEGINGADGGVTVTIDLTGAIGGDGLFVVADAAAGGGSQVADADLVLDFDFQNGPDAVVLRDATGAVVDALGYGTGAAFFAGEGSAAPDAAAGESLMRLDGVDRDDNALDFVLNTTPTPGSGPLAVPEPRALLPLCALAVAARVRRRA